MSTELVFVYGTLRKGQRANHYLETSQFLDEGRLDGYNIYDLGSYPGVKKYEGFPSRVKGEVYEVSSKWIPILDRYEGCRPNDPEQSLYLRAQVDVWLVNRLAKVRDVWVYVYNNPVDHCQIIPSGDWLKR